MENKMREKLLKYLANMHLNYPWLMLSIIIIITVIFAYYMNNLAISTRTSDMLPEGNPKVVQFNEILDEFVTASNLVVVVQGEEGEIKQFAEDLAPKMLELTDTTRNEQMETLIPQLEDKIERLSQREKADTTRIEQLKKQLRECKRNINLKLFQRIDFKSEIDFLQEHALMLIKAEDLQNNKDIFYSPNLPQFLTNLNNSLEKEYIGREESISTREKEDNAVGFLDGIENFIQSLEGAIKTGKVSEDNVHETVDNLLYGDPYMLSYDKSTLLMIAVPNFTLMDRAPIITAADFTQNLIEDQLIEHPDVQAGLTGSIAREHDEQVYAEQSFNYSTLIALFVIFIILTISFRMWISPIFAIMTLITGVIWALGSTAILIGQLNMITSMMLVILIGLGIDFSIHMISGFTEIRARGEDIDSALHQTFQKNGKGIITGALTTACAFLSLTISSARGMREMGIVTGGGLVAVLLATFLLLPLLLIFRERLRAWIQRIRGKETSRKEKDLSLSFLGKFGQVLSKNYLITILITFIISLLLIISAFSIKFDHNYMNIEPEGLTSIALMDTILDKYDLSIEYSHIIATSLDESRQLVDKAKDQGTVALVEDISLYLPSADEQQRRRPYLQEIKRKMGNSVIKSTINRSDINILIEQLDRLQMNVMEMQDMAFLGGQDKVDNKCKRLVGNPVDENPENKIQEFIDDVLASEESMVLSIFSNFQKKFAIYYKNAVLRMCNTDAIHFNDLPVSIKDRYSNKTRDKFLLTVYPAGNIWDKDYLQRHSADLERVSPRATGMVPLFVTLIKIFGRDGRNAILLTILIVFILLLIDFRRPRIALISMIPLAMGVFWMVGLMALIGMDLNIVNLIGLPLIIGIGIDDGVHVMHRWQIEGSRNIFTVFSSTGKAIFLTSLTTMFAFGSLVFSIFKGWASFGGALAIGVVTCFLATVTILPGILGLMKKRSQTDI